MATPKASLIPLTDGVLLIEQDLPEFSVRGALISGNERSILWDTLANPGAMEGLEDHVVHDTLTVVYSHGDWDHVWGTSGLAVPLAEVLGHPKCATRFETEIPATLMSMREADPDLFGPVELVPPTRLIDTVRIIPLGGASLEIHPLPGHTEDTLVGFHIEERIFFAGDAAESPLPFLNPDSPVEEWIQGLETWATRLEALPNGCRVVPSHGPVAGPELLRANARYLSDILAGAEPLLGDQMTPFYQETHQNNLSLVRNH